MSTKTTHTITSPFTMREYIPNHMWGVSVYYYDCVLLQMFNSGFLIGFKSVLFVIGTIESHEQE